MIARPCPHCDQPLAEHEAGLRAHLDCAAEHGRAVTAARIEADLEKARRDERAALDAAAEVGARRERERIIEILRRRLDERRTEARRSLMAPTLQALVQRAAELEETVREIEGGETEAGGGE